MASKRHRPAVHQAHIRYRKIDHPKYKYELLETYEHSQPIAIRPDADIEHNYMFLGADGILKVKERYAWDGPSGPTRDTPTFMRGSLVHDALYQLMRERLLDPKHHRSDRKKADELLRSVCREDGMHPFRAWYVYWGVRIFGCWAARPKAS